ncbi:hypothetical protein EJ07DRAFT_174274 [Lizonia empirigonia]|nr:hypothetical protein EJ07DRAFT_174274 [Lizonia empirigonia]
MSLTTGSFEDVDAWAKREFSLSYAALRSSIPYIIQELNFDGDYVDGKIVWQPMLVIALEVGSTTANNSVYACLSDNNGVELFSEEEKISPSRKLNHCIYRKPVMCLADITLKAPFKHLIKTGHPAGVNQLETLIRYIYLSIGFTTALQSKLDFFRAHFRDACHDVARGMGTLIEDDEMDNSDTLPDNSPGDVTPDTETASLRGSPAAASVSNEHAHPMDENYHDFEMKMLDHLGTMKEKERNRMTGLEARVQHLEGRLTVAEEERRKLVGELDVLRAEAKAAVDEMETWKKKYEGLKGVLQGALGEQF